LSIGAKAGIGVSIAVVALLILCLLLFFLLRHRRQGQTKQNTESTNDSGPAGPHELSTKANTHELLSKEKAGELNAAPGDQAVVQYLSGASEIRPQTPHEVDATPLSQGQKAELGGQRAVEIGGPVSPTPISRKAVNVPSSSNEDGASPETEEQREERLRVLEERIERIREDKERLAQLQRLTELEEETKREIMNVRRGESWDWKKGGEELMIMGTAMVDVQLGMLIGKAKEGGEHDSPLLGENEESPKEDVRWDECR
jgi:hypothetical protein